MSISRILAQQPHHSPAMRRGGLRRILPGFQSYCGPNLNSAKAPATDKLVQADKLLSSNNKTRMKVAGSLSAHQE
jgi:hypothetical protein